MFSDLKGLGGTALRFDFAIHEKGKLIMLIEYDGEFHYRPIRGQEALERQQIHDNLKNKYCSEHGISLLRIPYWESENIEKILEVEQKGLKDL